MAGQKRVVMGKAVTLEDGSEWVLWSDGQVAGRYWAFARQGGGPTRWLEVRAVTRPNGALSWVEARD